MRAPAPAAAAAARARGVGGRPAGRRAATRPRAGGGGRPRAAARSRRAQAAGPDGEGERAEQGAEPLALPVFAGAAERGIVLGLPARGAPTLWGHPHDAALDSALLGAARAGLGALDCTGSPRAEHVAGRCRERLLRESEAPFEGAEYAGAAARHDSALLMPQVAISWTPDTAAAPVWSARERLLEARVAAQCEDGEPLAAALLDWRHLHNDHLCDALECLVEECQGKGAASGAARGVGVAGGGGALALEVATGARGLPLAAAFAPFSALDWRAAALAPLCAEHGVPLTPAARPWVASSPSVRLGCRSRRTTSEEAAASGGARERGRAVGWREWTRARPRRAQARRAEHEARIEDVAVAWVLRQPGVAAVATPYVHHAPRASEGAEAEHCEVRGWPG